MEMPNTIWKCLPRLLHPLPMEDTILRCPYQDESRYL